MSSGVGGSWRSAGKRSRGSFRFRALCTVLIAAIFIASPGQSQPEQFAGDANLKEILAYIHNGWDSLTRSTSSCAGVPDSKLSATQVLYLPAELPQPQELDQMQSRCGTKIERLPEAIHELGTIDAASIRPPGLLYLKNKYVVPGGRFNEMYGWDSYFIIRGLLRDGRIDLARGMVEN
jgi:alpha,alpha-trehalase